MIKKNVHWNKKTIFGKAKEYERRANNLDKIKDDFGYGDKFQSTKAELYEKAGEHYLNAKNPRKAISCYEAAAKNWAFLDSITGVTQIEMRAGVNPRDVPKSEGLAESYRKNGKKDLKNAERIRKTIKGNFQGLEGKSIAGIIGIAGLLGSVFLFSSNITGNIIGNLSSIDSNISSGIFLLVGFVGCFFYFKNKK